MTEPAQPDIREQPGLPPLARSTLDRAAHHRRDEAWLAQAWERGKVLVVDVSKGGRAPAVDEGEGVRLVLVPAAEAPDAERWFLGLGPDGTPVWTMDAPLPEIEGVRTVNLRDVGHLLDDGDAGIFTAAAALAQWHKSHKFSPRTGLPTKTVEAGWAKSDTEGNMMWPRTDPAMIVLVHDGAAGPEGRCLLGHNSAWGNLGDPVRRFSCLAGFVEPGESAEASVAREVTEEVGVRIGSLAYAGSQSWPFPGSLMLGFHAYADPAQPIRVDPEEIAEARWFTRDDIAKMITGGYTDDAGVRFTLPMASSIAFYLIERWLGGLAR